MSSTDGTCLGTQPLLDALTDHLAVYHRNVSSSKSDVKIKEKIYEWFRSLTLDQRCSILTVSDKNWVSTILRMHKRLRRDGPGFFLLLADVFDDGSAITSHGSRYTEPESKLKELKRHKKPNHSRKKPSAVESKKPRDAQFVESLPSFCFRKAKGLLLRLNEDHTAGEILCKNLEFFSSQECDHHLLDTVSISEKLLQCAEEFIAVMESITHGQFLLSTNACQDLPWEELPWLKSMGYYSLPAFLANKLELVMWSSWLQDDGIHRPPRNLLKQLRKTGHVSKTSSTEPFASATYRRNRCFRDWWIAQPEDVQLRALRFLIPRAVKVEVIKIQFNRMESHWKFKSDLDWKNSQNDETRHTFFSLLARLEEIGSLMSSLLYPSLFESLSSEKYTDNRWIFFSSLNSADTLVDRVTRRVRSALQVVMVKCMEAELLKGESCTLVPTSEIKKKKGNKKKKSRNTMRTTSCTRTLSQEHGQGVVCSSSMKVEKCEDDKNISGESESEKRKQKLKVTENNSVEYCFLDCCDREDICHNTKHVDMDSQSKNETLQMIILDQMPLYLNPDVTDLENTVNNNELCSMKQYQQESPQENLSMCGTEFREKTNLCNLMNHGVVKPTQDFMKRVSNSDGNEEKAFQKRTPKISQGATTVCPNAGLASYDVCKTSDVNLPVNNTTSYQNINLVDFDCKEAQYASSPASNNISTPRNASRSTVASHMSKERYWDGLRSSTHKSQRSAFGFRTAHEWPGTFQVRFSTGRSPIMPPATERLHLDVGRNWQQWPQAARTPLMQQHSGMGFKTKWISSRGYPLGFMEETNDFPSSQVSFKSGYRDFDSNGLSKGEDEIRHGYRTPDDTDYDESTYFSGDFDDHDGYLISEEESERQILDFNRSYEGDYNQYFGGGVMFWNTADYAGTGYSRPPSLSSDDSAWARHEADLSIVLDDTMGFSPAYATVASPQIMSTSPPTATYHPGYEYSPVNNSVPRLGLPLSAVSIKSEDEQIKSPHDVRKVGFDGIGPDGLIRPILRPIVVVHDRTVSRQLCGSESGKYHEVGSPCVPHRKHELIWQRRPPSPVLRSVSPSPPPPPPSPVSGFGKRKGLTTVRSGSSSPRRWGLMNSYHKENEDTPFVLSQVIENALGTRAMRENTSMHPMSTALLRERFFTVPPLGLETEHPDVGMPMQTTLLYKSANPSVQTGLTKLHNILHKEIEGFRNQVATENLLRKPFISAAVEKVAHAMKILWPRSRLKIFGSTATSLALPCSDVDLVVCLPPVRNLEPIKEAGILEGRNGIKETCLQHAARYLADQDWVLSDTLKTIEKTAIPIITLVAHVQNLNDSENSSHELHSQKTGSIEEKQGPWGCNNDREFVRLDISFESPSHTGLRTAELVRELTAQFPAIVPLALVLKQFLTDRSLDHPYTGGLSSYCLILLITRFLQHQHHLGWPFQLNLGSLLIDFLHFFGRVFDPRRMGICIRGGGMYVQRSRGHCIDPLHIEDPLYPSNNVGRNCFRILQCVKAFSDAYSFFEKMLMECLDELNNGEAFKLLPNILPSSENLELVLK